MNRFHCRENHPFGAMLFQKMAELDCDETQARQDMPAIALVFGEDSPAPESAWRIVWDDGTDFLSRQPLIRLVAKRWAVAELRLLVRFEGQWWLLDTAAFSVLPGNLKASQERAIHRVALLLLRNARRKNGAPGETIAVKPGDMHGKSLGLWWKILHRRRAFASRFARIVQHEDWRIGVIDQPIERAVTWTDLPPVRWIGDASRKRYLADPFGWPGIYNRLLCEEFDFDTQTGSIKSLSLEGSSIVQEETVRLPFACHLSFPFLYRHGERVYCLPESSAAGTLQLFEWQEQDAAWKLYATPLAEGRAADAILFEKDRHWFIAYTDLAIDPFDNLNLLHAPHPSGPWLPHPENPVKLDPRTSRPAGGVFWKDGQLFRPAQDCARTYGGAIRVMEITACTPFRYAEREVNCLLPENGPYPDGLHTLSAFGERTLIDGKRHRISLRRIAAKLRRRMRG